MDSLAGIHSIIRSDLFLHVGTGIYRHCAVDLFVMIAFDMQVLIGLDHLVLVVFDYQVTVIADRFIAVIFDANILVSLGMDKNLLFTLLVLDTKFIKAAAAGARVRLNG